MPNQYLTRAALLETVINALPAKDRNDRPAIRQAMNDIADSFRRDGYTVPDFAQDRFVRDAQAGLRAKS